MAMLEDHNWDSEHQLGVIEKVWVSERKTYARARFSEHEPRAKIVWPDILAEIKRNVSFGYSIDAYEMLVDEEEEASDDEVPTLRVTNWTPLEVSVVTVPADHTVGFGRQQDEGGTLYAVRFGGTRKRSQLRQITRVRQQRMNENETPQNGNGNATESNGTRTIEVNEQVKAAGQAERDRVRHIMSIGAQWNCAEEARAAVDNETPIADFMAWVLENRTNAQPAAPITALGLSKREIKQFSICKAIRELSDINGPRVLTGLEGEANQAMCKLLKRETGGFFLPPETTVPTHSLAVRQDVAMPYPPPPWTTGANLTGGALIQTDYLPLIDFLRIWLVVRQAGARVLTGLSGNIAIPKQTGAASCFWLDENAPVTFTVQNWIQIGLTPKRLSAGTIFSRQLVIQSTPDVENLIRSDLAEVMAAEMDRVALYGDGTAPRPRGIINQVGINRWEFGTDPLFEGYVKAVVSIDDSRVNLTSGAWIANPRCWGAGISTPKFPNTGITVVNEGTGRQAEMYTCLGYPYLRTQQIPNTDQAANVPPAPPGANPYPRLGGAVFFGNWSDLLIGQWAGFEVVVDPYTLAHLAQVRVVVLQFADLNVRYPEAFAVSIDNGYGSITFPFRAQQEQQNEKANHGGGPPPIPKGK